MRFLTLAARREFSSAMPFSTAPTSSSYAPFHGSAFDRKATAPSACARATLRSVGFRAKKTIRVSSIFTTRVSVSKMSQFTPCPDRNGMSVSVRSTSGCTRSNAPWSSSGVDASPTIWKRLGATLSKRALVPARTTGWGSNNTIRFIDASPTSSFNLATAAECERTTELWLL